MNAVLWGNIAAFLGSGAMAAAGFVKSRRATLLWQNAQFALLAVSNLLLGAATGAVSDGLSIARNTVCLKVPFTRPLQLTFLLAQAGMTVWLNRAGLIGWIPFLAAAVYTVSLGGQDELRLKKGLAVYLALWAVYNLCFRNYTGFAADLFSIGSCAAGIRRIRKSRENA